MADPLGDAFGPRLRRLSAAASARAERLRRLADLADLEVYSRAREFARRYGVGIGVYPDARDANLDLLPSWVDPRAGLVVDLGANEGEWTESILRVLPGLEIVAAEPGFEPLMVLRPRFEGRPNVEIVAKVVTDSAGSASFHRTESSVFASLLPPSKSLRELYPESPLKVLETVEVETVSLDELVGGREVSVLKLDVQGGELAILRGGKKTLARTGAVLAEVLFLPHYEGDATFAELNDAMADLGFSLMDMSRPSRVGEGPALWADACYARPGER